LQPPYQGAKQPANPWAVAASGFFCWVKGGKNQRCWPVNREFICHPYYGGIDQCAQKKEDVFAIFTYDSNDIKPDSIVFETIHEGMACGPISNTTIYICNDIEDIS
jgi:hypothetical protein